MLRLLFCLLVAICGSAPVMSQAPSSRVAGYQVGAFVDQAHAEATKQKLRATDLFGEIHQKSVNGVHYWVVLVPVSDIPFENIRQKLLDAGVPVLNILKDDWDQLEKS